MRSVFLVLISFFLFLLIYNFKGKDFSFSRQNQLSGLKQEKLQRNKRNNVINNESDKLNSQQKVEVHKKFSKEIFSNRFPGEWNILLKEDQSVHTITNGEIKLNDLTTVSIYNFSKEISPFLGVDPQQIAENIIEPSQTRYGKNFKVLQTIDGIEVYDATLILYVSKKNKSVEIIDNQLIPNIESFKLKRNFIENDLRVRVTQRYSDEKILGEPKEFVYFSEGQGELVYRYFLIHPKGEREVLISEESAEIVKDQIISPH